MDNRPLKFEEFEQRIHQMMFVSATPGPYELEKSPEIVEQIIRPTGLVDPRSGNASHPRANRRPDRRDQRRVERNERVLVTTLTKKMAED